MVRTTVRRYFGMVMTKKPLNSAVKVKELVALEPLVAEATAPAQSSEAHQHAAVGYAALRQ